MDIDSLAEFTNVALMWIGFGTILGLFAQILMPGNQSGGAVATLLMGIAGTLVGCLVLVYFYPNTEVRPMSVEGFIMGGGGAGVLLLFYKVLGGYWLTDGENPHSRFRRRRKNSLRATFDE